MDPLGDHALACSRTGLLARRAKVVERAWVRVARVVPQPWLAHTTATGVPTEDRRRLDLVVYGATANGGAVLRRNTGVPPHEDRAPACMHSGSGHPPSNIPHKMG